MSCLTYGERLQTPNSTPAKGKYTGTGQVTCMVAAGGLSGGLTASMAGGSFWEGVCNGLICSGLNHALQLTCETISGPDDPPGSGSANNNSNYINNGHLPPGNRIFR